MKKFIVVNLLIVFFLVGCTDDGNEVSRNSSNNENDNVEIIQSEPKQNFSTEDKTLLEKMYVDVDSDGEDESIKLYTAAQTYEGNRIGWDDGQDWLLLVKNDGKVYPLYNDYLQTGQLEFCVVSYNNSELENPDSTDLKRHIYVVKATFNGIKVFDYYWDKDNHHFKKDLVFYPPNQRWVKFSQKYIIQDPGRIEKLK